MDIEDYEPIAACTGHHPTTFVYFEKGQVMTAASTKLLKVTGIDDTLEGYEHEEMNPAYIFRCIKEAAVTPDKYLRNVIILRPDYMEELETLVALECL